MKKTFIPLILLVLLLTGCEFTNRQFVDFTVGQTYRDGVFYVVSQRNTDLSESLPSDCYLPDGTLLSQCGMPSDDNQPLTSSTSFTAFTQALLGWGNRNQLLELSGIYSSCKDVKKHRDYDIMLSGKVILPADRKFKRYILVSHYTIGSNAEAPSNCFSLEGIFAKLGYCVIIPDYLGYGVTADSIHPYLQMEATAYHVLSMYQAVKRYFDSQDIKPEKPEIILLGYSQGGATTMAVQMLIETQYSDSIQIRRVYAGGGVYDVKATYDRFVETNEASYPVAVPLVVQGMIAGDTSLKVKIDEILQPHIYSHLDEWINSKNFSTALINKAINTRRTDEILSPLGMNRTSDQVRELYKELSENSIVNYDWEPRAPVYMLHSINDETVPFESNAVRAKTKWSNSNIEYNFGEYGTHVMTCLRFIYTIKPILEEDD